VNWQDMMNRLAPLRRQWDLAVLANLAAGTQRPGDLIEAINAQASDGRRIGWKVLNDTLRRLERTGYVSRREITHVPRETRYRLRPPGHDLMSALTLLDCPDHGHGQHENRARAPAAGQAPRSQDNGAAAAHVPRPPAA
jgi:DNA-binding HxlR family transcriptional regulator